MASDAWASHDRMRDKFYRSEDDKAHVLRRKLGGSAEDGVLVHGVGSVEKDHAADRDVEEHARPREGVQHGQGDGENEHEDDDRQRDDHPLREVAAERT